MNLRFVRHLISVIHTTMTVSRAQLPPTPSQLSYSGVPFQSRTLILLSDSPTPTALLLRGYFFSYILHLQGIVSRGVTLLSEFKDLSFRKCKAFKRKACCLNCGKTSEKGIALQWLIYNNLYLFKTCVPLAHPCSLLVSVKLHSLFSHKHRLMELISPQPLSSLPSCIS